MEMDTSMHIIHDNMAIYTINMFFCSYNDITQSILNIFSYSELFFRKQLIDSISHNNIFFCNNKILTTAQFNKKVDLFISKKHC